MEEFEDFYNEEQESTPTPEQIEHLEKIKDNLARANYAAIVKYGIDASHTDNPEVIKEIIKETMFYFEELEEYEKCSDLKAALDWF